jgi:RNA polymerase sigma-70 factor (ECF subfamily)
MKQEQKLSDLMERSQHGDRQAYHELLEISAKLIRSFLYRRLQYKQDIEDILQESLIAVHKSRHTYQANRAFKPWLFAITNYKLQDYFRKHYRKAEHELVNQEIVELFGSEDVTI